MLFDIKIGNSMKNRSIILEKLKELKSKDPNFTIIDIGGSLDGWSSHIVDAIMDINPPVVNTSIKIFVANLNKHDDWKEILEYVKQNGKFSYAICSHTLEDIANPTLAMDMMPMIATDGYIAVPSKYREFSFIEGKYRGYIHHRWIYDYKDGKFIGFPKLSFIEYETDLHRLGNASPEIDELSFQWSNLIDYEIVNNDYMGPSVSHVKMYYKRLL